MSFLLALCVLAALAVGYITIWNPKPHAHFYSNHPLYFAHRGALHYEPENTLDSFMSAVDLKMPALEIDVLSTEDGVVVCSHNFDLERKTDGEGLINEMKFDELKNVNAASGWENNSAKLPRLEEVVENVPEHIFLNIEIKTRMLFDFKAVKQVVRMVHKDNIENRIIISSFNPLALVLIKIMDSSLFTGFIMQDQKWIKWTNWIHPDFLHPEFRLVNADLVKFAKERGLGVNVWTVNTRPAIEWLRNLGVDGIITDRLEFCNV